MAHDPQPTTISQPQNESTVERMEISSSESSDSIEGKVFVLHWSINFQIFFWYLANESNVTHRSIRVPASKNRNESRSRSTSAENHREHHPALSSSEESLSKKD